MGLFPRRRWVELILDWSWLFSATVNMALQVAPWVLVRVDYINHIPTMDGSWKVCSWAAWVTYDILATSYTGVVWGSDLSLSRRERERALGAIDDPCPPSGGTYYGRPKGVGINKRTSCPPKNNEGKQFKITWSRAKCTKTSLTTARTSYFLIENSPTMTFYLTNDFFKLSICTCSKLTRFYMSQPSGLERHIWTLGCSDFKSLGPFTQW
jgi:hypothetical protein